MRGIFGGMRQTLDGFQLLESTSLFADLSRRRNCRSNKALQEGSPFRQRDVRSDDEVRPFREAEHGQFLPTQRLPVRKTRLR
jgi:hypothetical protein